MIRKIAHAIAAKGYRQLMLRGYFRKLWYPRYQFQYFPRQLCFLAHCLDRTADVDGSIVEIGCAHGLTTTFLYEYLADSGIHKEYVCIDTFCGFTPQDIHVEKEQRGKVQDYEWEFKNNSAAWFKESLARRHITDIKVLEADISTVEDSLLPDRISFCLLDVDLYQPVRVGLERIYPRLSPDGIIVVDDCWSKPRHMWVDGVGEAYDGAMQAYKEFTGERGLPAKFAETKLALIEKPLSGARAG
ncbi:class I SAM-dependent methyltransferase [Bradyrhizobium sp. ARR65]|uniref:class I SAM-dependent methyltransferase n=1 Tax=Bradyrhizobium sp. ARR65 TaxID=1040989 RepID=UPI000AD4D024|nr:class I SAM-dependent methyltransferase [Bradyrhizobium sp. ARR65]